LKHWKQKNMATLDTICQAQHQISVSSVDPYGRATNVMTLILLASSCSSKMR
jgi:hypothetical protein